MRTQFVSVSVGVDEQSHVVVHRASGGFLQGAVHVHVGEELHMFGEPETVVRVLREALRQIEEE